MASSPFPSFPVGHEKPVCVFCASSAGNEEMYTTAAESLGQALAAANTPVVYGGGRRGIMGVISQSTLQAGGYVHGVLPKALVTRASEYTVQPGGHSSAAPTPPVAPVASAEGAGADLLAQDFGGKLTMEVVGSMHERKAKMAKLSTGGFVVLPGGFGTFEEVMEMVTWNQIGMHALPVIVLNIGNYYTPMKALVDNGVKAGFISEKNAKLVEFIDLGDEAANADPARAAEWGPLAVKTLQEWKFPSGAGYGFKWEEEKKTPSAAAPVAASPAAAAAAPIASSESSTPYLFSTGRYTSPAADAEAPEPTRESVLLWNYHVSRLQNAHAHFVATDSAWGMCPSETEIWETVRALLRAAAPGTDHRLRLVLHPGGKFAPQLVPVASGAMPPFCLSLPTAGATPQRPMVLDSAESPAPAAELPFREYKTSRRAVYEAAAARCPGSPGTEVVMHAGGKVLEGVTSNVAFLMDGRWVTPAVGPMLRGTMRRYLLDIGEIVEGEVAVEVWDKVRSGEVRVCAFNGLRGVWEGVVV